MMDQTSETALARYVQAYTRLYGHSPKDARVLSGEWLIVNGAQLRASELAQMTDLLETEYAQAQPRHRSFTARLTAWVRPKQESYG